MIGNIQNETCKLLEKSFGDIMDNFEVNIHEGNKKGEGFLGEIMFVSLTHKKTKKEYNLAIKQVLPGEKISTRKLMTVSFLNESCMYTKIIPTLQDFQKSFPRAAIFDEVAKCYGTISEIGKESVILQNLKFQDYEVHPKTVPVPFGMYHEIFKLYGKYHALSFAFKELYPEKFTELISPLNNYWLELLNAKILSMGIKHSTERVRKILEEHGELEINGKFQRYVEEGDAIFENLNGYSDPYGVILHGDAWSNNMMFKFNESREVEGIKLLDFQISFLGSPVFDLSYCLYSGADAKTLNTLDELLEVYHGSLTENLEQYNLNADKIYPYDVLKTEWKKYSPYGFITGLLVWGAKTMKESEVPNLNDILDREIRTERGHRDFSEIHDTAVYGLVKHMYERNFL